MTVYGTIPLPVLMIPASEKRVQHQKGRSASQYGTLNLGLKKSDSREAVMENFSRFCRAIGVEPGNMVFSDQIHGDQIAVVGENDRGKGIFRNTDIIGKDGLMTCQPGVALVTFYADCVPLFFLDPVYPAIAVSHAGWRGTVKIGKDFGNDGEGLEPGRRIA